MVALVARGLWRPKVVSKLEGLPKGHDEVTTYGDGGGIPIKMKSGPLTGWTVGGGKRSEVYGKTFHPSTPDPEKLRWGFLPMAPSLDAYPSDPDLYHYYESLPQNITRPGGELVEMMITPKNVTVQGGGPFHVPSDPRNITVIPFLPFFFVSDKYTAGQVRIAFDQMCSKLTISDPILLNSTGNIQPGRVVQFYRGDTAAMLLQGYDNANEQRDSPNLVPNPPFPSNVSVEAWECMNGTIGRSIPLMHGASSRRWAIVVGVVVPLAVLGLVFWCFRKELMGLLGLWKSRLQGGWIRRKRARELKEEQRRRTKEQKEMKRMSERREKEEMEMRRMSELKRANELNRVMESKRGHELRTNYGQLGD